MEKFYMFCNYLGDQDSLKNLRPKFQREMQILSSTKFKTAKPDKGSEIEKCHSNRMRNTIS